MSWLPDHGGSRFQSANSRSGFDGRGMRDFEHDAGRMRKRVVNQARMEGILDPGAKQRFALLELPADRLCDRRAPGTKGRRFAPLIEMAVGCSATVGCGEAQGSLLTWEEQEFPEKDSGG